VLDAKPLLLVNNEQAEVLVADRVGEQPMGTDDHVDGTRSEPLDRVFGFFIRLESAEGSELHREPGEAILKRLDMLLDEERGGDEHRNLLAVLHRLKCGANRDLGFPEADVS